MVSIPGWPLLLLLLMLAATMEAWLVRHSPVRMASLSGDELADEESGGGSDSETSRLRFRSMTRRRTRRPEARWSSI